jgi:hypothetical protein
MSLITITHSFWINGYKTISKKITDIVIDGDLFVQGMGRELGI